jgi:hypothetical protein
MYTLCRLFDPKNNRSTDLVLLLFVLSIAVQVRILLPLIDLIAEVDVGF